MSGRLLRLVCAAAVATQAVLVAVPAAAEPEPVETGEQSATEPVPDESGGQSPAEAEPAEPGERSVAELLTDLQRLYRDAERATEAYNATEEKLRQRRAETARLERELARARLRLHDSRTAAGRLARQQYQSSTDISPYVRLLLARDPQRALDQGHVIGQVARGRAETVDRLTGSEQKADELARKARKALDDQLVLAERRKKERDDVRRHLKDVEELLASLTADQLAEVAKLERDGIAKAQERFVASGALSSVGRPTAAGERAVRFAVRQIGKPYQWGAEGPRAYDCSGLTSEAWAHAGRSVPRTSQEQWARLERVPLRELRPGDLVVYFPEATHVALYLGDGMVVQAPRPGARIKVSPIAANPVLGAVRPDPGGEPVAHYAPPELPEGATDGSDEGYAPAAPETSIR
ncbi:NlpC/P60 family protein [Streptomyces sp. DH24]|uniref:C40 family peptidase n=1 Tax=Streptomyces sp. DH24 TaxID=3040123 RepID=UPI002440FADD|nr:NlpC/P60 family protein [Streptomyces sp. DH24]MDG9716539.1 NlpC/P60 family protein [Streptomyces sp. DH24]